MKNLKLKNLPEPLRIVGLALIAVIYVCVVGSALYVTKKVKG